jgi:hypothetical protein
VRENKLTIRQILAMLAEAPQRIVAATAGVEQARLHASPDEDEWSASDILAHLRACADVWGGSIVTMVNADHPTIRAISPRTYIHKTNYPDGAFGPSFEAYNRQRAELLAFLERLAPDDWSRGGTFTGAGRLLERTVLSEASAIALHERPHIKQIERVVNSMRIESGSR